ncbi:MAG TPA: helix-turn-helix domain-containing protein [Myxococcota bacterium]|nr:helix-turn-helix domain-containing protein [Myxococcota bacterium]
MPKLLRARPSQDTEEERQVRKLANSRHAPGDWSRRARMIVRSWDGLRTTAIARELQCHPQTVRERILRFNAEGLDGLGDRPGPGRKPRLTEAERSAIVGLVATEPPGRLLTPADGALVAADPEREAHWTLDALTAAAQERGIAVHRSQVRRILVREGARWRRPRAWATSSDPDFAPKGRPSSRSIRSPRRRAPSTAPTNSAP